MLASILREDGKNVIAKTTGSKASFILPDGEESDVPRRGLTSIIEQKGLIKKAANLNADCFVAEIMSIHPENHFIEAHRLLKPNIVVLTNVRCDHIETMGKTEEEIASVFALDITKESTVFIPEKENREIFVSAVKNAGGKLICVKKESPDDIDPQIKTRGFPGNIELVNALCNHLNIDKKNIISGLKKVNYDIGEFKVWKYSTKEKRKTYFLANGFAANDPESTFEIISKLNKIFPFAQGKLVGLLSLRADRGDRTIQWIETLKNGGIDHFKWLYVTGTHAKIVKRKLEKIIILKDKRPEKIMETVTNKTNDDSSVIFGFGNFKGIGSLLIDYWNKIGEEYGI
jgi:poly-gamma-glutamate synthase PgsB/CapB